MHIYIKTYVVEFVGVVLGVVALKIKHSTS